jgi:hypothetical protein
MRKGVRSGNFIKVHLLSLIAAIGKCYFFKQEGRGVFWTSEAPDRRLEDEHGISGLFFCQGLDRVFAGLESGK